MSGIDWSRAPADAEAGTAGNHQHYAAWYRKDGNGQVQQICEGAGVKDWMWMGGRTDFPIPHELRPEVIKPAQWTGEGLPPVGVSCEYQITPSPTGWFACQVKYHLKDAGDHDEPLDERVIIWCPHLGKDQVSNKNFRFRPIKTPEQIAAEARQMAIDEMVNEMRKARYDQPKTDIAPVDMANHYAAGLYDAGYRRVTPWND